MSTTQVTNMTTSTIQEKANSIVSRRTLYAAGAGLIPFPILDAATLMSVQVLMIRDIAKLYDVEFKEESTRTIITTLVGDVAMLAGVKMFPVVGMLLGGLTASLAGAATTYALGKVFIRHFESGGTFLNFDMEASKAYFKEVYAEGKEYVTNQKGKQEGEEVDEKGWLNWFNSRNKKQDAVEEELADLRKSNEELKAMVAELKAALEAKK